jgi:two-component system OmpR family response regulator
MKVSWAQTGADAMRQKDSFRPDIVLVDLELPDMDGVKLIEWLAARQDCGIIVVSGRGEEIERVGGIEKGADDYITKPVAMHELVARIRAVHRRAQRAAPPAPPAAAPSNLVMIGSMRVDLQRRTVTDPDGALVHLTTAEFATLVALVDAAPNPVARETICQLALRRPFQAEDRGVDQLILNLRRKLFADEASHNIIISVRGAGYAIATGRELLIGTA